MRYLIPQGTLVSTCQEGPDGERPYRAHVTKRDLEFEEAKFSTPGFKGAMVFERDGWVILVASKKVRKLR